MGRLAKHYDDISYIVGAGSVVLAAFLVSLPLGFLALGVALIALAFFLGGN